MLRILKQKAKESKAQIHHQQELIPRIPAERQSTASTTTSIIVSHVPISIGSRTISSSTESTISSKSDEFDGGATIELIPTGASSSDCTQPDEQQMQEGDSRLPSRCTSSSTTGPEPYPSSSTHKPFVRRRAVSLEEDEHVQKPMTKKPRLYHFPNPIAIQPPAPLVEVPSKVTLLAREEDECALPPLHAFVRKQIEVFTATPFDLKQPAPGRKQAIKLQQVGLRCIHCKHNNPNGKQRVKRAVCYPTNVRRIYHSVSDMKFDHFSHCKNLPIEVKAEFERLKAEKANRNNSDSKKGKRGQHMTSSSTTAQYYHDSAVGMGMSDQGPEGIFMTHHNDAVTTSLWNVHHGAIRFQRTPIPTSFFPRHALLVARDSLVSRSTVTAPTSPVVPQTPKVFPTQARTTLEEDTDEENLNKIHCFVRKHVEFFAANGNDVAAPSPGRKTRVILGQVGIRCVHCTMLPPKHRVKRAICYPPTLNAIYHGVSNMKFDHFANCRALPPEAREEFRVLQDSCRRKGGLCAGSKATSSKGTASSTAKYYQESAARKGLVDTETGIRFGASQQPTASTKGPSLISQPVDEPTGMSALVQAACQAAQ